MEREQGSAFPSLTGSTIKQFFFLQMISFEDVHLPKISLKTARYLFYLFILPFIYLTEHYIII